MCVLALTFEENVQQGSLPKKKQQFNVSWKPLFPMIPLDHVVIDNLRLFLRVSDSWLTSLFRNFCDWIHLARQRKLQDWADQSTDTLQPLRTLSRRLAFQDFHSLSVKTQMCSGGHSLVMDPGNCLKASVTLCRHSYSVSQDPRSWSLCQVWTFQLCCLRKLPQRWPQCNPCGWSSCRSTSCCESLRHTSSTSFSLKQWPKHGSTGSVPFTRRPRWHRTSMLCTATLASFCDSMEGFCLSACKDWRSITIDWQKTTSGVFVHAHVCM